MKYFSTRGAAQGVTAAQAIAGGLAGDGGLYVPERFPPVTYRDMEGLIDKPYYERASFILSLFLDGFDKKELDGYTRAAYRATAENGTAAVFDHPMVAPLHKTDDGTYILELWHGPTAAFKDMALQVMPRLMTGSLRLLGEQREVCVLAATSGDTGKAALEGFCDVKGTRIMVFYPEDGVSEVQKLQMTTQKGDNVSVCAVRGNFDDAQRGVKDIFSDAGFREMLSGRGIFLSSANSINWGRLVPQIAYYISAYCDLLGSGAIKCGDEINICVPTGNFGNILAAYYAKRMGLPVKKLICASNRNDVLTQFISTGIYDKNRTFYATRSPSMDILVSSNLERLLFELSDKDGEIVSSYMSGLSQTGRYRVPQSVLGKLRDDFAGGYCSEEDTMRTIKRVRDTYGYLIDTHTAVAFKVFDDYMKTGAGNTPAVIVSTASPFKFASSVLSALGQEEKAAAGGMESLYALSEYTGIKIPAPLEGLAGCRERFNLTVDTGDMAEAVSDFIKGISAPLKGQ